MRALSARAVSAAARAVATIAPTAWPPHGTALFHPAGDGGRRVAESPETLPGRSDRTQPSLVRPAHGPD